MGSRLQAKNEKQLKEMARLAANKKCAVCTCVGTQYTCQPPNIYVCETCAGAIRSFPGFRVKSMTMATYSTEDVNALKEGGNEKFLRTYLSKWNSSAFPAPSDKNVKKVETFVRQVLVEKIFYSEDDSSKILEPGSTPTTEGEVGSKSRKISSTSLPDPGWQAFGAPIAQTPAISVNQSQTGPSSDSWADFTPAPPVAVPSRQVTGSSVDYSQIQAQRSPSMHSVGAWSEGVNSAVQQMPQSSNVTAPQTWNAFETDPFPQNSPPNGSSVQTSFAPISAAGSSPGSQAPSKPKAPVMKELPEDLFGPPQNSVPAAPLAVSNPFGFGAPAVQPNNYGSPIGQQASVYQQPAAQGTGVHGHSMGQEFQGQIIHGYGQQQQVHMQRQLSHGAHHLPQGSFSQSPTNAHLMSGFGKDETDQDSTLFGNLVGDLRSNLPKSRPPAGQFRSQSFSGHHPNAFPGGTTQQGIFDGSAQVQGNLPTVPQQNSAFALASQQQPGTMAVPVQQQTGFRTPIQHQSAISGGVPHPSSMLQGDGLGTGQGMQTFGYQLQTPQVPQAYGGLQQAMMAQPQGVLPGSVQQSGNPFA